MRSRSHETRTAATSALSQIFTLVPLWEPSPNAADSSLDDVSDISAPEFPTFSVRELMEKGTLLLASSGKEFVRPTGILSNSSEVKKARKEAMGRLGLDFLDSVGGADEMDLDKELAADEADQDVEMLDAAVKTEEGVPVNSPGTDGSPDIAMKKEPSPPVRSSSATPAAQSPATTQPATADLSALSARERNRLKRKRKPGNSAFVAAPLPTQVAGSKFSASPAGSK